MAEKESSAQRGGRRAYSFPASDMATPDRAALPFVRKAKPVNNTSKSFKSMYMSNESSRVASGNATGVNTPHHDSPFDSTSESDKADDDVAKRSPTMSLSALHPPPPLPRFQSTSAVPVSQSTLSSPLHTARPSLDTRTATSPIARMGSSSRSREDIISWARGVDSGATPTSDDADSAINTMRGRPRRPRHNALSGLTPPSTESLDGPVEHTGSTPTSASRALSALSFTPVVNALRRVSIGVNLTQEPSTLGLNPMPAPAEVSIIDVVVGTHVQDADTTFPEGDTPTLSTVSMSEAHDPSNTDFGETIDTITDDFSVVSSCDRRGSHGHRYGAVHAAVVQAKHTTSPLQQRKTSLPLRPIQTTASAFWSFSSYLRSLTPFGTAATPLTPTNERVMTPTIPEASAVTHTTPAFKTAPVPTNSTVTDIEPLVDPAQDMVRSVPMNIVITDKAQALVEERLREREATELLKAGRTPPTRVEASRSPSPGQEPVHEAASDEDDTRRGRARGSRRAASPPGENDDRGRRRDRMHESRERSWSAHRGRTSRSRTARPAAAVAV